MEWIVGALALVVVVLIALNRRSTREGVWLTNYAVLILLDETAYAEHRKALANLVHAIEAKDAADLGGRVHLGLIQLAEMFAGNTLGVLGLLWKLKNASVQPDR